MADDIVSGATATAHHLNKHLDTVFARESSLTEEQFSFIIHNVDQGAGSADIVTLLNDTFSLKENIFTVEETISWIRCNFQREMLLLKRAKQYLWCTTQRPAAPNTHASNNKGRRKERRFNDEMRAFMLWRYELGHRKTTILDSLNAQFEAQFNISSMKICLGNIANNDRITEFLRQHAMSYDWWKPPPSPDSRDGVRAARHARLRAASKRHAERTQVQKQWINGNGEFKPEELLSPEATAGKGKMRAHSTAADGTLTSPIKIEDSDGDGDDAMSDAVLNHFDELADEMVQSPSDQLSPTPFQRVPRLRSRLEVEDGEMEL